MLHNTGSYGQNETPVNMGAPLNMSQLSSPMNVVQNLSTLGKAAQQVPQAGTGHFSLPSYPSYAGAPSNMGSQIHPFPNHHSLGLQSSYVPQNSSLMPNLGWQNGVLPMNLNINNEHPQNMSNYSNIDRRSIDSTHNYKEREFSPKVPLNIPQVPSNYFHRHFEDESNSQPTINNHYKPYEGINDLNTKPHEKLLSDNTRRKNLENTVRLIENILINTTKNRELQQVNESKNNVNKKSEIINVKEDVSTSSSIKPEEQKKTEIEVPMEISKESYTDNEELSTQVDKNTSESIEIQIKTDNIKTDNEDQVEQHIDICVKLEPEEISEVEVKIEPISSWTDTEHTAPFLRDVNGVLQEDVGCVNVIDSESSVAEATKMIESGPESDTYFECPYCSLLFKHPKRFLIHTKWHMFGLINEQREEMAREKEIRRQHRKEARQHDTVYSPVKKTWPCKDCDKVFHAKGGLDSHRKRYHTNRIRECKMCAKTITGWAAWKTHMATHNTDAGYQCTLCPKRFKYSHSLTKHKDTHLEKTHGCSECPKMFGSQALLKVHMKSHERVKQGASFHCSFCGKAFFDKFNLQIHERTHTNERPFVCEICNATFGCNSNLSRHMKVSHSSAKPFECSTCHRCFAAEGIRDRHELRVHGDPEDFKYVCKQCPSRYMKLSELKKHTYKMHPKSKNKGAGKVPDADDDSK